VLSPVLKAVDRDVTLLSEVAPTLVDLLVCEESELVAFESVVERFTAIEEALTPPDTPFESAIDTEDVRVESPVLLSVCSLVSLLSPVERLVDTTTELLTAFESATLALVLPDVPLESAVEVSVDTERALESATEVLTATEDALTPAESPLDAAVEVLTATEDALVLADSALDVVVEKLNESRAT